MDISNRSLIVLLLFTTFLVAAAAVLAVGVTRTAPAPTQAQQSDTLVVIPQVVRQGGQDSIDVSGPLVVDLDPGVDAGAATLTCSMFKSERVFQGSRVVFRSIPFGDCSMQLAGTTQGYTPVYPGDRLRCAVVDGRTSCVGGVASQRAATVSVSADLPAHLKVDGDDFGPLPVEEVRLKVGRRELQARLEDGRTLRWNLVVQPEERITVHFPNPDEAASGLPGRGSDSAALGAQGP